MTLTPACACDSTCSCSDNCNHCGLLIAPRDRVRQRPRPLSKTDFTNLRVVQRCLVYVIGLSPSLASEKTVVQMKYFGQYGTIVKCVVKAANPYKNSPQGVSYGCYITYSNELEAAKCIMAVSGYVFEGRELLATYGSTKYCVYFLKNLDCSKPDCLYLHQYGKPADTFTRDEILRMKTILPPDSILQQIKFEVETPDGEEHCLPKVHVMRIRRASCAEPHIDITSPLRKPKRKSSRFEFVEPSAESAMEVPLHIEEIVEINSPVRETSQVPAKHIAKLLSPDSPERWMSDLIETDDSDLASYRRFSEDDASTVILRAKLSN